MRQITIKELLALSLDWTLNISQFYTDFRDRNDDVTFRKLLITMIDQEDQYTEYYKDNLAKLNLNDNFVYDINDKIDFNDRFEEIPEVIGMTKIDFLRKAVHYQDISIRICDFLKEISKTDKGKQVFKELLDEETRHMFIFKDHLELEELFLS